MSEGRGGWRASAAPTRSHEPHTDEEDDGANEGNQDASPEAGTPERVIALQGSEQESADEGPEQPHDKVADQAEPRALHHLPGQPAGNQAHEDPGDEAARIQNDVREHDHDITPVSFLRSC